MGRLPSSQSPKNSVQAIGYAAAVVLPWISLNLAARSDLLHNTPLALNFAVIAAVGTFFELGPALTSVLSTTLSFNYLALSPYRAFSLNPTALVHSLIIFSIGILLVLLSQSRRGAIRKLRAALASSNEVTEALIQAQQGSRSAAWLFDTQSRKTSWYTGGSEIFGRSLEELTATGSPTGLVICEDLPLVAAAAKRTEESGEAFRVEFRVVWPNGEIRWLEASGVPVPQDNKLWRGVTMDITDRKVAELALVQSEKLAAAGRLASSIAHELNNPLESVMNLVYLAKTNCVNEDVAIYLSDAETELRRVAEVCTQTLRFHRQQSSPCKIDIGKSVRSLTDFYGQKLAALGIEVHLEVPECLEVICHETELRQVVSTLMRNAIDAMSGGGNLRIRCRMATDWRTGSKAVRIAVSDTGVGMSPEIRRRVYEPFFTTKGNIGTGLSLWVAAGIVDRRGGSLHVRSSKNPQCRGSTFTLILPPIQPSQS